MMNEPDDERAARLNAALNLATNEAEVLSRASKELSRLIAEIRHAMDLSREEPTPDGTRI